MAKFWEDFYLAVTHTLYGLWLTIGLCLLFVGILIFWAMAVYFTAGIFGIDISFPGLFEENVSKMIVFLAIVLSEFLVIWRFYLIPSMERYLSKIKKV